MLFGYMMAGGIVLLALWRFASGKRYPAYLVGFYLILSLIITGFAVYTTYTGNKLVYTHGVGVKDQSELPDKPELRKQKSDSPLQKAPITKQK
jgi:uncharacterized membrane protein